MVKTFLKILKKIISNALFFGYEYLVNHFLVAILSHSIFWGCKNFDLRGTFLSGKYLRTLRSGFLASLFGQSITLPTGFFGIRLEL